MPEDVQLQSIDQEERTLVLRRSHAKVALPDRLDLLPPKPIRNDVLRNSLMAVIDAVIAHAGTVQPIENLLTHSLPVFSDEPRQAGIVREDDDRGEDEERVRMGKEGSMRVEK